MTSQHAQLIVLTGPDGGRRILLDYYPSSIGRSAKCQITLAEQYVSREHGRFTMTEDGVVLEVLAPAGLEIGETRYKQSKCILLGTGDVLRLGPETEILFVDIGGDADAALAEVQAVREAAPQARRQAQALPAKEVLVTDAQLQPRRRKTRRLIIGGGVCFALMIGVFTALSLSRGSHEKADSSARPPLLTLEQVTKYLQSPVDERPDVTKAQKYLDLARQKYSAAKAAPGNRYLCILYYKQYKAVSNSDRFADARDQAKFDEVKAGLLDELWPLYQQATVQSQQGRWHKAAESFAGVRELVPDQDNGIVKNVQRHLKHIQISKAAGEKRSKRMFGQ